MGKDGPEVIFADGKNQRFLFNGEELILGPIGPQSKAYLQEGMKRLSLESLRNRFFGGKKEFTSQELQRLTDLDGTNRFALGLIRDLKDPHGLGLIRMDRVEASSRSAEVALTIIDEYQKKGLGTVLLRVLILAAIERGYTELRFTYLHQNTGFERLLGKFPAATTLERDQDSRTVALDLNAFEAKTLRAGLRPYLPEI